MSTTIITTAPFPEQEAHAQVCVERDGGPLHRGDDPADQRPQGQPRISTRSTGLESIKTQARNQVDWKKVRKRKKGGIRTSYYKESIHNMLKNTLTTF